METSPATVEIARGEAIGRLSRWQVLFIAAIGVLITICEWVFAYQNVAYGIVIALGLAILIYIMLSTLHFEPRISNCGESLALIPLYILFTSSLPWFFVNEQYLLPAVYSVILGLCLWHIYQRKLSLKQLLGFSKETLLKYSLLGLVIGIPLGLGEYFILHPAPAFPTFEVKYLFRDIVYMLLFVGLGDYHLAEGSPCVDAGDPLADYSLEPEPNGAQENMGDYGNTLQKINAYEEYIVTKNIGRSLAHFAEKLSHRNGKSKSGDKVYRDDRNFSNFHRMLRFYKNKLILNTDSKSQLIPTNRMASGTTTLIHQ